MRNTGRWRVLALCGAWACGQDGPAGNDAVPDLPVVDAGAPQGSGIAPEAGRDGGTMPVLRDGGVTVSTPTPIDASTALATTDAAGGDTADAATVGEASRYVLDCGDAGIALESAGPPKNRVNYAIVGDGYTEADLGSTYLAHLKEMLRVRFLPESEVYLRYRKFVNICALKTPSPRSGIGETRGDSAFGGYGNDASRLGYVQDSKVTAAIARLLPKEIEVDWIAVVLNGNRWWNAGGQLMVWSGGHKDAGLAAMHEGGHSFFLLADEYGGNCTFNGRETEMRINVTRDGTGTAGKWSKWLDFTHAPGTGKQGIIEGAEYCDKGAYRPSQDSVMNSLWRSSYLNAISREQAVRVIYGMVQPIDDATPADTTAPGVFFVRVVDPKVIDVAWHIDGAEAPVAKGERLDVAALGLPKGKHSLRARASDNTPWVRGDRTKLEQTKSWSVDVP
ncbi:MAG: hypothetical protein RL385_2372 [Pseudomonadota bacterium]